MNELKLSLNDLLRSILSNAGSDFSGVGIIIAAELLRLPITNLRSSTPPLSGDLVKDLGSISSSRSSYHDGFHVIDDNWKLRKVAQYFSPPIKNAHLLKLDKDIGGRYAAAQFGSNIEGVIFTGIATRNIGIAIFENGVEVHSEGPN